jgi:hypothetical protein
LKKIIVATVIFFLIISTALIKNSAKKNEDENFTLKENLRVLNYELDNLQLENDYLSSPDKLLEYQVLYFDDELIKQDIRTLKKIEINNSKIVITNFTLQKN